MRWWLLAALAACGFRNGTPTKVGADASVDVPGPVPDARRDAAVDSSIDAAPPADIVIEAESYSSKVDTVSMWSPATTLTGFNGSAYMQCGPGNGTYCPQDATFATCSAYMRYTFTIAAQATYYVHVRTLGTGSSNDSAWYGADDVPATDALAFMQDGQWHWRTGGTTYPFSPGPHSVTIWQRECGASVDTIAVTTKSTYP